MRNEDSGATLDEEFSNCTANMVMPLGETTTRGCAAGYVFLEILYYFAFQLN